jgi:hypothetical protein
MEPLFDLDSKNIAEFEETDIINGNTLKGYMCRSPNTKYGMLYITHVNGKECPQNIWGTPKMHYPMDQSGKWVRIEGDRIEAYEKLDGTNILCYRYFDADGNSFVGYKTRLRPTLGESKFGNFVKMWKEILVRYPEITNIVWENDCNLAFEMYGKRNKILIEYEDTLDIKLLYGVRDGRIIPPSELDTEKLPCAEMIRQIPIDAHFQDEYEKLREELNKQLQVVKVEVDGEEKIESMSGMEGSVIYVIRDGYAFQYKAKPDDVLDIHWAEQGIPYHAIYTTIVNSFELEDEPGFELVMDLLKEEFEESDIYKKEFTIKKMIQHEIMERKVKAEVFKHYEEHGFDINKDKTTCMRWFGQHYSREKYGKKVAAKIFTYLWREYGGRSE